MTFEDIENMIEDCLKRQSKLTDWEAGFIDSISLLHADYLSSKQRETLEKIWNRIT